MTRIGHPRARRALREHRSCVFAAAVMLLAFLGATLLVSAGSPHHEHAGPVAVATATVVNEAQASPESHDHQHGNDWSPTLGKRLRPAATVSFLGIVPARVPSAETARRAESVPLSVATGDVLTVLGVLRV